MRRARLFDDDVTLIRPVTRRFNNVTAGCIRVTLVESTLF
ncbi:hypothetical protein WQQ_27750 [Hydrocarboniphaga effusa AP103]|uniref:Uncharacterized protein n=1 Tax=Hydrocarboniphaga effusa AP103 TaxID=1172194 RepID=I8T632_9GAMM|nr:hypothetical protein WQQ_27750 [Hydrocarboniphaga effusa AP103]